MSSNWRRPRARAGRRCHSAGMQMLNWIDDDDPLPPTQRALGAGQRRAGPAGGRRPADAAAPGRGLPPRHLPLVQPRPAGAVVEPRPAHGAAGGAVQGVEEPGARRCAASCASPGCELRIDSAFDRVIEACARTPREGQAGTWIVPQMVAAYTRLAPARPRAQLRDLGRRAAGGRAVRRGHRPHVLRRIDVRLGQRRVEDRVGRAGGLLPRPRRAADRLPAEHRRTWRRWARTRCRATLSSSTCPSCRGSRRLPIGPMIPACGCSSRRCKALPCRDGA